MMSTFNEGQVLFSLQDDDDDDELTTVTSRQTTTSSRRRTTTTKTKTVTFCDHVDDIMTTHDRDRTTSITNESNDINRELSTWYSKDELNGFRRRDRRIAKKIQRKRMIDPNVVEFNLFRKYNECVRGLEHCFNYDFDINNNNNNNESQSQRQRRRLDNAIESIILAEYIDISLQTTTTATTTKTTKTMMAKVYSECCESSKLDAIKRAVNDAQFVTDHVVKMNGNSSTSMAAQRQLHQRQLRQHQQRQRPTHLIRRLPEKRCLF